MLGNLWGVVHHGSLAAYYSAGTFLNGMLNIGTGVSAVISMVRGDVRGAITNTVEVLSNTAAASSQSSQAITHAIAAANSGLWLLVDLGNGVRWIYVNTIGSTATTPPPRQHGLLALPAPPPPQNDADTPVMLAIMPPPPITPAADNTEPPQSPVQENALMPAVRHTPTQ